MSRTPFGSFATNLVPSGASGVFVRDLWRSRTLLASVTNAGSPFHPLHLMPLPELWKGGLHPPGTRHSTHGFPCTVPTARTGGRSRAWRALANQSLPMLPSLLES